MNEFSDKRLHGRINRQHFYSASRSVQISMRPTYQKLMLNNGWLQLPNAYQPKELLVLTAGPGCLLLLRPNFFNQIRDQLLSMRDSEDERINALIQLLVGCAEDTSPSRYRRILVEKWRRERAQLLGNEVLLVPHDLGLDAVEVWSPTVFSEEKRFLSRIIR